MNIAEYAQINGLTPEQFKDEIFASFASVMSMEFDSGESNVARLTYKFEDHKINIFVTKEQFLAEDESK